MTADFVLLTDVVPDVIQEIRYYSTYNFIGKRIDGYDEPCAILTKKAAEALKNASDEFVSLGYRIKIFDAYRPTTAVKMFLKWIEDEKDLKMKKYFYPDVEKHDLLKIGYLAAKSSHSRGSTVDMTLFDIKTGKELEMGSPFDFFGKQSHLSFSRFLSEKERHNRLLMSDIMKKHGFTTMEEEWWHFTLADEPFPNTYFDFSVNKSY